MPYTNLQLKKLIIENLHTKMLAEKKIYVLPKKRKQI